MFRPPPTHSRTETQDGGFPHPPPPFGSCFAAMEVFSTLPSTETRDGRFPHQSPPFGSHFDVTGVLSTSPNPSLHQNIRRGVWSPTFSLGFDAMGCFQPPDPSPFRHTAFPLLPDEHVRATAVRRDVVLAGDPKMIRLLCNGNLNISIPSRGSKEERIRICLQAWSNIQGNGYRK